MGCPPYNGAVVFRMMDTKKRIELHYLEGARRASLIFPRSTPVPHEAPDLLLPRTQGILGIEITELCREEPRAEARRLA